MPSYSTRRLQGLDVAPADAKAMMRAKASKTRHASCGGGAGTVPVNMKASAAEGEASVPGSLVPNGFGAAKRVVTAIRCE